MTKRVLAAIAAGLVLAAPAPAHAQAKPVTVKLASFVPEGSIWDKALREMGAEWQKGTEGRVALTVFAGGQQGEEATVVSKMRLGTLQAASLTIVGLAQIDPAFNVFGIPFFYDSYEELHQVMDALTPLLRERAEKKGFVFLGWGDAGWVHVFSKRPVTTLEEMRALPVYTSAGDERMLQWYKENGFRPRALAVSDVPVSLQTGLIEAMPITPIGALFLQWYRTAPYMADVGLGPLIGGTVVTKRAWNAIGEADRRVLLAAAGRLDERLRREVPRQDEEAVTQMRQRGLEVTTVSDADAWRRVGEAFAKGMRGDYVPPDVFDRAVAERDAARSERNAAR